MLPNIRAVYRPLFQRERDWRTPRLVIGLFSFMTAAMPSLLAAQAAVTMRDIELSGILRGATREIAAEFKVAVATPIGRLPVTGHGRLKYDCGGSFRGSIGYHPIVRLFARIKGLALVKSLDGTIKFEKPPHCSSMSQYALRGRAAVDSTTMAGWVRMGGDSINFRGPTWIAADIYHGVLKANYRNNPFEMRINMYETPIEDLKTANGVKVATGSIAALGVR